MTAVLLIVLSVAVISAVLARLFRRFRLLPSILGAALIATGAGVYLTGIHAGSRPLGLPLSIGFAPPRLLNLNYYDDNHKYEFVASLGVAIDGCTSPVHATLVLEGTKDYFQQASYQEHALITSGPVTIALPGPSVRMVRLNLGAVADLVNPLSAPTPLQLDGVVPPSVRLIASRFDSHTTIDKVSARVTNFDFNVPLVVRFEANWLVSRGLGTCYLRLPNLVGPNTVAAAQEARGQAFPADNGGVGSYVIDPRVHLESYWNPSMQVYRGLTVVDVRGGEIATSDSFPAPNTTIGTVPGWSCTSSGSHPSGTYVASADQLTPDAGCAAIAVITLDSADFTKNLVILLVGVLISLGATLAILPWQVRYEKDASDPRHGPAREGVGEVSTPSRAPKVIKPD